MLSMTEIMKSMGAPAGGSLLALASELGLTPPFSLRDVGAQSTDRLPFSPLLILEDGLGDFRADQLRVYFKATSHQDGTLQPVFSADALKSEIASNFDKFFNGSGTDHDSAMSRNIAEVGFREDKEFNDQVSMQFRVDMNVFFGTIDVFDHHDDWVGFVQDDPGVFAVQTLERRFRSNDIDGFVEEGIGTIFDVLGGPVFEQIPDLLTTALTGEVAMRIVAHKINRMHFLAGRRSWTVRHMMRVENPLLGSGFFTDIFFFETAAVDRFSSVFSIIIGSLGDAALGNVDRQTILTWSTLLKNFVQHHRALGVANFDFAVPGQDFDIPEVPHFPHDFQERDGPVFINQQSFSNQNLMVNMPWVKAMLPIHPALESQL